jgi:hypothetical protein
VAVASAAEAPLRSAATAEPARIDRPAEGPEATPKEKMDGALGLMKQKNEDKKAAADAAVKLTQALKNMVEAQGGIQNNQAALLTMAQLEDAVQKMMADNGNAGGPDNMAGQPGNQNAGAVPGPAPGGDGADVSGGQPVDPVAQGRAAALHDLEKILTSSPEDVRQTFNITREKKAT